MEVLCELPGRIEAANKPKVKQYFWEALLLKHTIFAITIFFVAAAATASAQKNEIAVLYGKTINANRNILPNGGFSTSALTFNPSTAYQVTYARQFLNLKLFAVYAEVPFIASPKVILGSTSGGNAAINYSALYLTPGVRVKFLPDARISPWVSGGYGFAHYSASSTLLDGSPNRLTSTKNTTALQLLARQHTHARAHIEHNTNARG